MRKMIVVAVREYQAAVRTKAFIISIVAMPVFMGGSLVVQALLKDKVDTSDRRLAVVDQTGLLFDALVDAARERNGNDIFKGEGTNRKQVKPRFIVQRAETTAEDQARVSLDLSDRVRAREVFAFLIVGPDVVHHKGDPSLATISYHSNNPTYDDLKQWVSNVINDGIRQLRLAEANLDSELVARVTAYTPVTNLGLVSLDEHGEITKAKKTNEIASFMVPFGMLMLMFMVVLIAASPLVQSVLEEKMQRIAEVLLGSIPPFQLMMGKLVGMVGVSLTIGMFYVVGAFIVVHKAGFGQFFPGNLVIWFVVFQALAVMMYGSLFAAIGAAVSDLKEAQSMMMPVMLIVMIPMFVWLNVIREPASTFAMTVSLIPPCTPMLMIVRQAVPPGIPIWQPIVGVLLVLATTVLCVFVAGRIFRVGLLMQGKGAKFSEMMHWALRG